MNPPFTKKQSLAIESNLKKSKKIKYKDVEYDVSEEELTEIKIHSKRQLEIKEGFGQEVMDVLVTIWDNGGREVAIYTAQRIIDRIIDRNRE